VRKKGEEGMSKSRHTEAQMIGALKQLEAGRKAEEDTMTKPLSFSMGWQIA
jgi:hypothetical protein